MDGRRVTISASSELLSPHSPGRYAPANAFDGDTSTAWAEGAPGSGQGEYLTAEFERPVLLEGFEIHPGYTRNTTTFCENSVPRQIEVYADGQLQGRYTMTYDLELYIPPGELTPGGAPPGRRDMGCYPTAAGVNLSPRVVLFERPISIRQVRLTVTEVLTGSKYDDLCISEWRLLFSPPAPTLPSATAQSLTVLRAVRDQDRAGLRLEPDAAIEDLREKYTMFDYDSGWSVRRGRPPQETTHTATSPVITPRVKGTGTSTGDFVADAFLNYTRSALINKPVVLLTKGEQTYLIGANTGNPGDGEWIEFYPTLVLNRAFRLTALKELTHMGADPGCRDVIPGLR